MISNSIGSLYFLIDDINVQGKLLTSLVTFIFTVLEHEDQFHTRLVKLAESHTDRGIKSCEYSIFGDVVFWTMKECLG